MANIRIIENNPMAAKLLELFIEATPEFCLEEPAELILLDAREMARIPELRAENPAVKIVVMTDRPEHSYPETAQKLGAEGFWYQEPNAEGLLSILQDAMSGRKRFPAHAPVVTLGRAESSELTDRELEVLRQVVLGKTDAQIAETLSCAVSTVKHHIQKLREKTGLAGRVSLAVSARDSGLVIPEE